jgi:hypothetical protein
MDMDNQEYIPPEEPRDDQEPTFEDGLKLGQSIGYLEGYTKGLRFGLAKALGAVAGE